MKGQRIKIDNLAIVIKQRRKELGFTQKGLGEILGIDQRTLSALENNPTSISVSRLFAVLEALKLELTCGEVSLTDKPMPYTMTVEQLLRNSKII